MINKNMSMIEVKHVLDAAESHIRNYSAMITQADRSTVGIGSATCIEVGQRLFLATAAHNFKVIKNRGNIAVFSGQKATQPPLKPLAHNYSQYGKEGTLDLAWIELDAVSAARSHLHGLPLSSLDPYHSPQESLCYTIAGFPWERVKFHKKNGELSVMTEVVMYITIPLPPDPGDDALFFDYPDDAISMDGPSVPHPGGMSGGGVWAAPVEVSSSVWIPQFQLVAIPALYLKNPRRIRALPIYQWLELLLADHPELSQDIEPLLNPVA